MNIEDLNKNYYQSLKSFLEKNKITNAHALQSLERFEKSGLPTTKNEFWKYTALNKFLPENIDIDRIETNDIKMPQNLKSFGERTILFVNGNLNQTSTTLAYEEQKLLKESNDSSYQRETTDALELINIISNSNQKALTFEVNEDCHINLIFLYTDKANQKTISPRIFFKFKANSNATIYEQQISSTQAHFWNNPTISIAQEANSHVQYHFNSQLINGQISTSRYQANLKRDASFTYTQNFHNEKLTRVDFIVNLQEEGSEANLAGFYQINDNQHHDTTLTINHLKSHTRSSQLFKGILDGDSRGVFNGMVEIHKDAQKVDATQLNKNLLLSKKAHVDTRPQLQVAADDVKAAHGATIGQLDQEELFYLMARGIPQIKARSLLLAGYGQQIFEGIENSDWKFLVDNQNATKDQKNAQ